MTCGPHWAGSRASRRTPSSARSRRPRSARPTRPTAPARTAEGGPTHFQGKSANSDGRERFTASSLVFTREDGAFLEAGGFQPVEAYDVCIANLDRSLERRPPAEDPVEVLHAFSHALTTREIATVMAPPMTAPDDAAVEDALIAATGAGVVAHESVGDGALWRLV